MLAATSQSLPDGVHIAAEIKPEYAEILTPDALKLIAKLEGEFSERRHALLKLRSERQAEIDYGFLPEFLSATRHIREDLTWKIAPAPSDLQKRWVEITGPTDRKMVINALNSGADVFMADFEDANSPTWANMVEGQINLRGAVNRTISYTSPEGKNYNLNDKVAVLMVRPRGWHLEERHVTYNGLPVSAALFDFGLYFFHNIKKLLGQDTGVAAGPYFYLPKLENHLEARLWNDVFQMAQDELGIPRGTIRATVLVENILAVFEMEEILYELREHSAGLNAGRWDYIFSAIKKFRNHPDFIFPDRAQITMAVPFMRAYTELVVKTCHKRGGHAIGGMAAYIPSRKDQEVNEKALVNVRADKLREVRDGFDGTWVAHPDLVPVARLVFEEALRGRPHQKERQRPDVPLSAQELLNFKIPGGEITESGIRTNINVGLLYLESWLRGHGAVAIYNLMEDTATAEISRAQLWQWTHNPKALLSDGRSITKELYFQMVPEELEKIRSLVGKEQYANGKFQQARQIYDRLVCEDQFSDFMTLIGYDYLD